MATSNNTHKLARYIDGELVEIAEFRVSPCGKEVDITITNVQGGDVVDNCFELEAARDWYRALRNDGWA